MRALLLISMVLAGSLGALAGDGKSQAYPVRYEGGNLPVAHAAMKATVGTEQLVLKVGRQRISVPATAVTEIAYGNGVRRRFGAPVLDVVPFMKLGEAESHYVGVSWTNGDTAAKSEALFRLSNSEYHDFL